MKKMLQIVFFLVIVPSLFFIKGDIVYGQECSSYSTSYTNCATLPGGGYCDSSNASYTACYNCAAGSSCGFTWGTKYNESVCISGGAVVPGTKCLVNTQACCPQSVPSNQDPSNPGNYCVCRLSCGVNTSPRIYSQSCASVGGGGYYWQSCAVHPAWCTGVGGSCQWPPGSNPKALFCEAGATYECVGGPAVGNSCQAGTECDPSIDPTNCRTDPVDCENHCNLAPPPPTPTPIVGLVCDNSPGSATCACTSGCQDGPNTDYRCCHLRWGPCAGDGNQACYTEKGQGVNDTGCVNDGDVRVGPNCGGVPPTPTPDDPRCPPNKEPLLNSFDAQCDATGRITAQARPEYGMEFLLFMIRNYPSRNEICHLMSTDTGNTRREWLGRGCGMFKANGSYSFIGTPAIQNMNTFDSTDTARGRYVATVRLGNLSRRTGDWWRDENAKACRFVIDCKTGGTISTESVPGSGHNWKLCTDRNNADYYVDNVRASCVNVATPTGPKVGINLDYDVVKGSTNWNQAADNAVWFWHTRDDSKTAEDTPLCEITANQDRRWDYEREIWSTNFEPRGTQTCTLNPRSINLGASGARAPVRFFGDTEVVSFRGTPGAQYIVSAEANVLTRSCGDTDEKVVTCGPPLPQDPIGNFDQLYCRDRDGNGTNETVILKGFACDRDVVPTPIYVDLYADAPPGSAGSIHLGRVLANRERRNDSDYVNPYVPVGNPNYSTVLPGQQSSSETEDNLSTNDPAWCNGQARIGWQFGEGSTLQETLVMQQALQQLKDGADHTLYAYMDNSGGVDKRTTYWWPASSASTPWGEAIVAPNYASTTVYRFNSTRMSCDDYPNTAIVTLYKDLSCNGQKSSELYDDPASPVTVTLTGGPVPLSATTTAADPSNVIFSNNLQNGTYTMTATTPSGYYDAVVLTPTIRVTNGVIDPIPEILIEGYCVRSRLINDKSPNNCSLELPIGEDLYTNSGVDATLTGNIRNYASQGYGSSGATSFNYVKAGLPLTLTRSALPVGVSQVCSGNQTNAGDVVLPGVASHSFTVPSSPQRIYEVNFGVQALFDISFRFLDDVDQNFQCDNDGGALLAGSSVTLIKTNNPNPVTITPVPDPSTGSFTYNGINGGEYLLNAVWPSRYRPVGITDLDGANAGNQAKLLGVGVQFNPNPSRQIDVCVSSRHQWFQTTTGDVKMRTVEVFVPSSAPPVYASVPGAGQDASVFISSWGAGVFSPGDPSDDSPPPPEWGWVIDHEYSTAAKSAEKGGGMSYDFFTSLPASRGITIQPLPCTDGTDCILNNLATGVYKLTGDVVITSYTHSVTPPGAQVVILAGKRADGTGGNITIKLPTDTRLEVPSSAQNVLIFGAQNDIIFHETTGRSSPSSEIPVVDGIFAANNNIVADGGECIALGTGSGTPDNRLNIAGAIIAHAHKPFDTNPDPLKEGSFKNRRSLCDNDSDYPSVKIITRPDFIINSSSDYGQKTIRWTEVKP